MARRRGRRARRLAPLSSSSEWWRRQRGAYGEQQKRRQAASERTLRRRAALRIAGGRQPRQRQRSRWDVTPLPSPRLKTAHAPRSFACTLASHLSPLVEYSRSSRGLRSLSLSLSYSTSGPTRAGHMREPSTWKGSVGLARDRLDYQARRGSGK